MTKIHKMINLSEEVFHLLKEEDNASGLIDALLYKYFEDKKISNMTKEQMEERMEILEKKEIALEQLRLLKEQENKLKEVLNV